MVNTLVVNGNSYNDGNTPPGNMGNGGHRDNLIPMLSDLMADAGKALVTTSSTSKATGLSGSQTWTQAQYRPFGLGAVVTIARTSNPTGVFYVARVTGNDPDTAVLTATILSATGSGGPFTDWTISISGEPGRAVLDGTLAATSDVNLDNHKFTNAGAATAGNQYATAAQVQAHDFAWCGAAGGTANALTATPAPAISAYEAGQEFELLIASDNTASATLAVSGLSAVTIKKFKNGTLSNLDAKDLASGMLAIFKHDGTYFELLNPHVQTEQEWGTVGGTANAITVTTSPALQALTSGKKTRFKATANSTNAVTLDRDGLGAKKVFLSGGSIQANSGNILTGHIYNLTYDSALDSSAGGWVMESLALGAAAYLNIAADSNLETDGSGNIIAGRDVNLLLNPTFAINQRLASSNADDTYAHDRWYVLTQTGAVAVSTLTDQENGTPFMARLTQSQASAQRMGYAQIIEGKNCKHLRGKKVTLKSRYRCSSSQVIKFAILEWTGTEDSVTSDVVNDWTSSTFTAGNFFLGSNLTVTQIGSATPSAATLTDSPAMNGITLGTSFNNLIIFVWTEATAAQNVTLDLGKFKLEPGIYPTPFAPRNFQDELQSCLRYYEKSFDYATAPAQNVGSENGVATAVIFGPSAGTPSPTIPFKATKRVAPTMTGYNPSAANAQARDSNAAVDCSSTNFTMAGTNAFSFSCSSAGGSGITNRAVLHWTAVCEL